MQELSAVKGQFAGYAVDQKVRAGALCLPRREGDRRAADAQAEFPSGFDFFCRQWRWVIGWKVAGEDRIAPIINALLQRVRLPPACGCER